MEQTNYEKQGSDFLASCNVTMSAVQCVPQIAPEWATDGKHGIQWSISLHKGDANGKTIQFFFWDSIANKEATDNKNRDYGYARKKYMPPTAYAVLAGIYSCEHFGNFEDFCASYGYEEDSRSAERTYHKVEELNAKLESIFTSEELERLQEIQ